MSEPKKLSLDTLQERVDQLISEEITRIYIAHGKPFHWAGWPHKHTARWRYLRRRGARK